MEKTISNTDFLKAIFGDSYVNTHVSSFKYDPNNIPQGRQLNAWKGGYYSEYSINDDVNQYFTVSLFDSDDEGTARRRKSLFKATYIIVLDDVHEKLSLEQANKLPTPSYILETSPGSEQWGYILNKPCEDRSKVENLLDGLVANGLAPDGKDPGMKGVTRYVRLPEGSNNKESKLVNGEPFKCRLLNWNPFLTSSIEELAEPFCVNLDAPRREQRLDGATDVPDHPLLHVGLTIKEVRSNGRFDIRCPWVDEHTGGIDNGSAIFTNKDGSPGFKCHHGSCEHRTANDLFKRLEIESPGFTKSYKEWQFKHVLSGVISGDPQTFSIPKPPTSLTPSKPSDSPIEEALSLIRLSEPKSDEARKIATELLKAVDAMPEMDKHSYHQELSEVMGWTKSELSKIIKELRETWYQKKDNDIYDKFIYIREHDRFYDRGSKIIYTPGGFQNSFCDVDPEIKKNALVHNKVQKVDKLDFAPKMPPVFSDKGIVYGNSWRVEEEIMGVEGDCSEWLDHFDKLGWADDRDHILKWMAFTILKPEVKINHMLLFGGMEGTGKDFLLTPLIKAMGDYSHTIDGNDLLSDFNEYLLGTKYLHINETELGDHRKATEVSNKLKPLAAAPPETLRVNDKFVSKFKVRNIVNLTMTTNSQMPVNLTGPSRRFYAVWSDLNVRDSNEDMTPAWLSYWDNKWKWMSKGGVERCIYYLRNCVDISEFNPGAAPKMTEFLRNIRESSKSPAQQTIESFIENKIGMFSKDLITSSEGSLTLRMGIIGTDNFMYVDNSWFTPTKFGRVMRDISGCVKLRAKGDIDVRVWAIRDKEKYESMSMSELYEEYIKQS